MILLELFVIIVYRIEKVYCTRVESSEGYHCCLLFLTTVVVLVMLVLDTKVKIKSINVSGKIVDNKIS